MPFGPAYSRTKTFVAGGTLLPGDLNAIQDDLGQALEQRAPIAVVTTLPASPVDGQVVDFQNAAMATQGVVWRLRYRAGSALAHKWECVGGGYLEVVCASGGSFGPIGSAFQSIGGGSDIPVPRAGSYEVGMRALCSGVGGSGKLTMSFHVTGSTTGTVTLPAGTALIPINGFSVTFTGTIGSCNLAAGETLSATFSWPQPDGATGASVGAGTARFYLRPIRVG